MTLRTTPHWNWVGVSLALLVGFASCNRPRPDAGDDSEQRCASGDRAACARACERGVYGASGCMAAVHEKDPYRRTTMLTHACKAKQPKACVLAAEASVALGMGNARLYEKLLTRACEQRDRQGCEKLGDYRLLDAPASAKQAYDKACSVEPARAGACSAEVAERFGAIDQARAACKRDDLAACERLLALTAPKNHDLAYQGAEAACRLRGLSAHYRQTELRFSYKLRKRRSHYDRCGLFLLARTATDPDRSFEFQRVPLPAPPARKARERHGTVTLADLRLIFRDAPSAQPEQVSAYKAGVEARIRERLTLAEGCYEQHLGPHPETQGKLSASFIIDKLGYPLELRPAGELTDPTLSACVVSAAIPESFAGLNVDLGSIARVEATLDLQLKTPALKASRAH